jgi:RNA polymerase sigma-70 factor (ECF subfamily)
MIDRGMDKLSSSYREILILYYLEELSYREIADVLRVPIGTVGIRLKRARDALKKVYKELGVHYEVEE